MNQLRYGRGVDNRRFKASGFHYQHTSRETVLKLGEYMRLHPVVRGAQERYRYEREVEEFLRWSPHVKQLGSEAGGRAQPRAGRRAPAPAREGGGRRRAATQDARAAAGRRRGARAARRPSG